MKKNIACLTFSLLLMIGSTVSAAESAGSAATAIPDFKSCPALRDKAAYGEKYDDYSILVQGKDGHVFRSEQDFRSDFTMPEDAIALYKEFSDRLKEKNVDLIIAFTPTRGMTARKALPDSDPMTDDYKPATAIKNYSAAIAAMKAQGIRVVGTPRVKTGTKYFYKADQHWTTAGANEMAQAVAAEIKKLGSYRSIQKIKFKTFPLKDVSFSGRFNLALEDICHFKVPLETDRLTQTIPPDTKIDENALFGDKTEADIVIVGTSYSKREENDMNFSGALAQHVSAEVYNAAISGGGFDDSLIAYLVSDRFKNNPPKALVWEIPGYYALDGDAARKTLFQAIPSIEGDCANPAAVSAPTRIDADSVTLLDNLGDKNIQDAKSYVYLSFDAPVKKNFSVTYTNQNDTQQTLKFSRSKRYPHDGTFYFAPGKERASPVKSISLKVPPEMHGLTVTAKLCEEK